MIRLSTEKYQELLNDAIAYFWKARNVQIQSTKTPDQGNRSAVTGGRQLDGLVRLMVHVAKDLGIPDSCIHTKGSTLPGFFRPTKDWDVIIITPKAQLIAAVELKSQVGSFGNNFNNRVEEAIGSAVDLWTAFKENSYHQHQLPWIGYAILVEKTTRSNRPVQPQPSPFEIRAEFHHTSYLDRYALFCQKLMRERHYSSTALIWTTEDGAFGYPSDDISFDAFLMSYMSFILGKLKEFEE